MIEIKGPTWATICRLRRERRELRDAVERLTRERDSAVSAARRWRFEADEARGSAGRHYLASLEGGCRE